MQRKSSSLSKLSSNNGSNNMKVFSSNLSPIHNQNNSRNSNNNPMIATFNGYN
jgi:hypothetical protein